MIHIHTYDRLFEALENYQQVTTRNLQQWSLAASGQFSDIDFKESDSWIKRFKKKHKICQRKVTKFVSGRETQTVEKMLEAAETFRLQIIPLIQYLHPDLIINTDQTG